LLSLFDYAPFGLAGGGLEVHAYYGNDLAVPVVKGQRHVETLAFMIDKRLSRLQWLQLIFVTFFSQIFWIGGGDGLASPIRDSGDFETGHLGMLRQRSLNQFLGKDFPRGRAAGRGGHDGAAHNTNKHDGHNCGTNRVFSHKPSSSRRKAPRRRRCSVSRPHCLNLADGLHF
jgi:hypothetical protein